MASTSMASAFAGRRSVSNLRRAVSVRAADDDKKLNFQPSRRSVSAEKGFLSLSFSLSENGLPSKMQAASPGVSDECQKKQSALLVSRPSLPARERRRACPLSAVPIFRQSQLAIRGVGARNA